MHSFDHQIQLIKVEIVNYPHNFNLNKQNRLSLVRLRT